jgi:predicted ferric reductase
VRYIGVLMLLLALFHLLSFARYNWKNKNKLAAVGATVIGFAAVTLFIIVMFVGDYEL